MNSSDFTSRLMRLYRLGIDIATLPVARLKFHLNIDPEQIRHTYRLFTKRHPRYKIVRNKTLGMALVDLASFPDTLDYLHTVRGHGYAGWQGKKARSRGYRLREIDRNDFVDDIHEINTSSETRQGRPMDRGYREKKLHFEQPRHFTCYGAFDANDKLAAYCNVGLYGNFAATDQLLGYKNSDGAMYLLLVEIICKLIDERKLDYFMYDTFLGAQPGLREFKRHVGFKPYRVRYSIG